MLEIRYQKATNKLTAWCGDERQFGNLKDRGNEAIVILDIPVPNKPLEAWLYDEATNSLIDNPSYIGLTPPLSTHLARLEDINPEAVKPATVTRIFLTETGFTTIWDITGKEYSYDCYVTQGIVDEWQAGKIAVGDLVLIFFLEDDISKPILTHKIFRSWG